MYGLHRMLHEGMLLVKANRRAAGGVVSFFIKQVPQFQQGEVGLFVVQLRAST